MPSATPTISALPKEMEAHHYPALYEIEESHWWYVGRRRIIQSLVADICERLPEKPRILDVGCGTGGNLKMLAGFGQAEGVDISEQALEFCHKRGLQSVRHGAAERLPFADNTFDLITALDVIEHLDDDLVGLKEIRRVLKPGGRTLLFVPAFMFLWGVQDDVSNHRRRYTLPQLLRAVREVGLEVEHASYANIMFFVPILVVRTLMRWLGLRAETEYGINVPAFNGILSRVFAAERFFLRRTGLPFGVSAWCVARRPASKS